MRDLRRSTLQSLPEDEINYVYLNTLMDQIIANSPDAVDELYHFFDCFEKKASQFPYLSDIYTAKEYASYYESKAFKPLLKCDACEIEQLFAKFGLMKSILPTSIGNIFEIEILRTTSDFTWIGQEKALHRQLSTMVKQQGVFVGNAYNNLSQSHDNSDEQYIKQLFFKQTRNALRYDDIEGFLWGMNWIYLSDEACSFILPVCMKFLLEDIEQKGKWGLLEFIADFWVYAQKIDLGNFNRVLIDKCMVLLDSYYDVYG